MDDDQCARTEFVEGDVVAAAGLPGAKTAVADLATQQRAPRPTGERPERLSGERS